MGRFQKNSYFQTVAVSLALISLLSAQPHQASASGWSWGKTAAVVAGVAAVGYVAYRGYEHYEAGQRAYESELFSSGSGSHSYSGGGSDEGYYSSGGGESAEDQEADRIYALYLKKWNSERDADFASVEALHDGLGAALDAQAAASKESWVCNAICVDDAEDRSAETADFRSSKLDIMHLSGTVVSGEGKSPSDVVDQLATSCTNQGRHFSLINDVVKTGKGGVTNIGYVLAYAGNSCMLTSTMSVEQASQGVDLDKSTQDFRTKILDLKLDRADETASSSFLRELATYISSMETDSIQGTMGNMLSSAGTSKEAAMELMKKFTIKQDRATGNITLFDPKQSADERDIYVIHPELDRKTNLVSMRESVDFVFETAHACGTESHRVTVTLLAAPTKVKAIKDAPTASWLEAKRLASKAPSSGDDYCASAQR